MSDASIDPLKKQIHEAEEEIEAIECKIRFADLKTTYPDEYNAMRCEQEQHRQQILKSNASIDDQVPTGKGAESNETLIVDDEKPFLLKDRSEDHIRD
jgi:archaellum component FlaC